MKCEEIKNRLPLYSGGDLNGSEVDDVRSHLSTCGPCRDADQSYHSVLQNLGQLQEGPAPEGLWTDMTENIMKRIRRETPSHQPILFFPVLLKAAASLVLGIAVGYSALSMLSAPQTTPGNNVATVDKGLSSGSDNLPSKPGEITRAPSFNAGDGTSGGARTMPAPRIRPQFNSRSMAQPFPGKYILPAIKVLPDRHDEVHF